MVNEKKKTRPINWKLSALLFSCFGCRCLKAHIKQYFDFVIGYAAIQCNGEPLLLVHMISRENPRLVTKRTDKKRITFEICHIQWFIPL